MVGKIVPKLEIFIFIKIRYYKWDWNFEMSTWTIDRWYMQCQRMSTRDRYMVKIGEIFVHVVCEQPLKLRQNKFLILKSLGGQVIIFAFNFFLFFTEFIITCMPL